MRKVAILACALAMSSCGPSKAEHAPVRQPALSVASNALRDNLLTLRATFDGAPITDLRQTARCTALVTTARGSTPVQWRNLGNFAPRLKDGNAIVNLGGATPHVISYREGGKVAERVEVSLGLLDEECGGV